MQYLPKSKERYSSSYSPEVLISNLEGGKLPWQNCQLLHVNTGRATSKHATINSPNCTYVSVFIFELRQADVWWTHSRSYTQLLKISGDYKWYERFLPINLCNRSHHLQSPRINYFSGRTFVSCTACDMLQEADVQRSYWIWLSPPTKIFRLIKMCLITIVKSLKKIFIWSISYSVWYERRRFFTCTAFQLCFSLSVILVCLLHLRNILKIQIFLLQSTINSLN
jgi:hypothetical protein